MKIYRYPERQQWGALTIRPHIDTTELQDTVRQVLADVRTRGDQAVRDYELRFDHAQLATLAVGSDEMDEAQRLVAPELKEAIRLAHDNIRAFHQAQALGAPVRVETQPGVDCWQQPVAIEKVGLYIPGGTAPLFSTVLMLATPARIAGCREIVLCTPPDREARINPAILVAARTAGVSRIFKAGGVQAIGAMAYGTESVPKVFKIFGPGNQYVMAAKQMVATTDVAIDMPAGPSEVCVIADASAKPDFVAADLLSQAEHGRDSQVILLCTDEQVFTDIISQTRRQLEQLPRRDIAAAALENSRLVLLHDTREAMELSNLYAPEHLIIQTSDFQQLASLVVNAGSVFLGPYSCESAGDYASGTNHTLPTHGWATAYSGVNLDSFCRKITFQHLSAQGIGRIGRAVELMAEAEQLYAHKNAMTLRMRDLRVETLSD